MRKILIRALLFAVSAGILLQKPPLRSAAQEMQNQRQVIRVSASTFEFKPSQITLKKGVPVTLELTSTDRRHGFKVAEFHLHANVEPGVVEQVRFVPNKTGSFTFLCDVFCGEGHEEMSGTITVIEP